MNWNSICKIIRNIDKQNELTYQRGIKEMILEFGLGWQPDQITEQISVPLGSTERLIPDILVEKNQDDRFIIEVKKPSHKKTNGDIDQLVSYMKQLEIPVGIYWGDEIEVYYKTFGDGSRPIPLMYLKFKEYEEEGDRFIELFSEQNYCTETIREFKNECESKLLFESKVNELVAELNSEKFAEEVKFLIREQLLGKGVNVDVVDTVMNKVTVALSVDSDLENRSEKSEENSFSEEDSYINVGRRGLVGRYAYNIIRQIIEKNPTLNFDQMYQIFGRKNRIEKVSLVEDKKRWFMDERDIITLSDGTRIVISTQWGLNGACKPKMDNLIEIARKFGIDTTLPF